MQAVILKVHQKQNGKAVLTINGYKKYQNMHQQPAASLPIAIT